MLLYYITDRRAFPGDETARRRAVMGKVGEAVRAGVDYIQLREKDLSGRQLEHLAREACDVVRENVGSRALGSTRLLINSRSDVAIAVGADGVHLRADDLSPAEVRRVWEQACGRGAAPVLAVSCHTVEEVRAAARDRASFVVLAPIFEKQGAAGSHAAGIEVLAEACREKIPVFALGGVTLQNLDACRAAGAAGIAGIRLFQEHHIAEVVRRARQAPEGFNRGVRKRRTEAG